MNPRIDELHPYPFQKLAQLFEGTEPPDQPHLPWLRHAHSSPESQHHCVAG